MHTITEFLNLIQTVALAVRAIRVAFKNEIGTVTAMIIALLCLIVLLSVRIGRRNRKGKKSRSFGDTSK